MNQVPRQKETEVTRLYNYLMTGCVLDRVIAWRKLHIADVRSRLSDVKRIYGLIPDRKTKPGKRYLEYWVHPKLLKK